MLLENPMSQEMGMMQKDSGDYENVSDLFFWEQRKFL